MAGDGWLAGILHGSWVFSAGTSWLTWRYTGGREKVIPWAVPQPDWATGSQGQTSPRDIS